MQTETSATDTHPAATHRPADDIRQVYARLVDEGHDTVLTLMVVYGIAEGFSRELGHPHGDPYRFHEGPAGAPPEEPPAELDMETLCDRSRDAIVDERLFDGLTVEQIEDVALVVGADVLRDRTPRP